MSKVKGYKVFNKDWTCRGFQYEVGKTYEHKGNIELCGEGFHFCQKARDCFNYYDFDSSNKVAEVEGLDLVETDDTKSVTNKIHIIREIPWMELLTIVNEGLDCTGLCNTGHRNTGNYNAGNRNTGDYNAGKYNTGYKNTGGYNAGDCNAGYRNTRNNNTGDYNAGDYNVGHKNTGDCNTGHRNTGNYNTGNFNTGSYNAGKYNTGYRNTGEHNTGDHNTGKYNTGDYNTGDRNAGSYNTVNDSTGLFNTEQKTIDIFNKPSKWTLEDWYKSNVRNILSWNLTSAVWIYEASMTDLEKENNPTYKTTGGYLKEFTFKEAWANMWKCLTQEEKNIIINELPNFDAEIFKEITGITV